MKKNVLLILINLFAVQLLPAKDIVTKDMERLPAQAKQLIMQHFPEDKISYIKIDEEIIKTTYDVVFVSGTEIDFLKDGNWIEIDCKRSEVPNEIIPEKITSYVKQNFYGDFITRIEKKRTRYEIELSNKLELIFDKEGNFIRMDN